MFHFATHSLYFHDRCVYDTVYVQYLNMSTGINWPSVYVCSRVMIHGAGAGSHVSTFNSEGFPADFPADFPVTY